MDSIAASTHARERTSFTLSLAGLGQRIDNGSAKNAIIGYAAGHSWTNAGTNSQVQVGSKESQVQGGSLSMESESQFLL